MDPFSFLMAIIGILTAAQNVPTRIGTVVSKAKKTPKEMRDIKSSVDTIRTVLSNFSCCSCGSRVYKRSLRNENERAFSAVSAAGRTASWSMLSGLSLSGNISIIAVQALPVYAEDLSNSELYKFGVPTYPADGLNDDGKSISKDRKSQPDILKEGFNDLTTVLPFRTPIKASSATTSSPTPVEATAKIFDVALQEEYTLY